MEVFVYGTSLPLGRSRSKPILLTINKNTHSEIPAGTILKHTGDNFENCDICLELVG
jgi:hypothetical protein